MNKTTILSAITIFILVLTLNPISAEKEVCIYDFYVDGCPHCKNVENYLDSLTSEYNLRIMKIDANQEPDLFRNLLVYYNVPEKDWGAVPTVFVGDFYCIGDTPCVSQLEEQIKKYPNGINCINPENQEVSVSFRTITLLALADSVNPCEMAVLILILTTILMKFPESRKKTLYTGLSFSLAIFLCYILLGGILIFGFKSITNISSLSTIWIYKSLGVIAIIMGILNVKDFFFYKQGSFATEMPLSWRPKMKKIISSAYSPRGAFIIGILITVFLLPCTSGPYFVAGGLLANLNWNIAFLFLIYYNLLFILPMLVITLLVYRGFATVEDISGWKDKNIKKLHLIAGTIMIIIGLMIVSGLI
jgi:glutaredoxin